MKKATLLAVLTLTTFMFAGVNLTYFNNYAENANGDLGAMQDFGVWFDVNDKTAIGWENGFKVAWGVTDDAHVRLGYNNGSSLGVNYTWWNGGGEGWKTSLSTALDFTLTDDSAAPAAYEAGDMNILVSLGFGF